MKPEEEINELGIIAQPEIVVQGGRMVELLFRNGARLPLGGDRVGNIGDGDTIMLVISNSDAFLFESVEARMLNKLSGKEISDEENTVLTLVSAKDNIIMLNGNQFKYESLSFDIKTTYLFRNGGKEPMVYAAPEGCLRGDLKELRFQVTLHKESR